MRLFQAKKHKLRKKGAQGHFFDYRGQDPASFEKDASESFASNRFEDAFSSFRKAADVYRSSGNHKQSALCFVSAASCWSLKSEEKTFFNAAAAYEEAAREAEKSGDFEYASLLYKYASINYERDGEFIKLSDCVYASKESLRAFLTYSFFLPGKIQPIAESGYEPGIGGSVKKFFEWLMLTFSWAAWGHGERPLRSFLSVVAVISVSTLIYTNGHLAIHGEAVRPDIANALYFSIVTFTTVGYGDMAPLGMAKVVAMLEVFSAIFIMPLFIMALTRKYLRM